MTRPLPAHGVGASRRGSDGALPNRAAGRPSRGIMNLIILVVLWLSVTVAAQKDPVNNFCRRFAHQTTVIDRRLYIDGGLINWNPLQSYPNNYTNPYLLWQDLDHVNVDGHMPKLYANLSKNNSIPDVSGGYLWPDEVNKKFYLFGGEYFQEPVAPSFILYSYDVLNNYWESLGPAQQASINSVSFGAGATVPDKGQGYYYGGWLSNNSVPGWGGGPPVATTGMVRYDMASNSWTNGTGPNDNVRRAEGSMVYIPAGDGGMLVYFGGVTDPWGNGTVAGQPMSQILIYDLFSSKWYTQNATGDVPDMRRRFCSGVTWVQDQSSYNIYIYGGASLPPYTAGFDDIYVLSLPSFSWVKLYPTDGNYTGGYPHHSLTCNVISGAQMLIIGGTFPLSQDCDAPNQWGTHNVDLGERNAEGVPWQLFDPNKTAYSVPTPVLAAIGGSAEGGTTKTSPAGGFDSPDLKLLMGRKATLATRTPTRKVPDSTGTSAPPAAGGDISPLSTGAIAGIAVGGAAGLAVLVLAVCCLARSCRRRRRRRHHHHLGSSQTGAATLVTSHHSGQGAMWPPLSPGSHYAPSSASPLYAPSPFLPRRGSIPHHPHPHPPMSMPMPMPPAPAELPDTPVGGGPAESHPPRYEGLAASAPRGSPGAGSGSGSATGTGTGGSSAPLFDAAAATMTAHPKMDDQGRLWMPQVSILQPSPGSGGGGGGPPPQRMMSPPASSAVRSFSFDGGGGEEAARAYSSSTSARESPPVPVPVPRPPSASYHRHRHRLGGSGDSGYRTGGGGCGSVGGPPRPPQPQPQPQPPQELDMSPREMHFAATGDDWGGSVGRRNHHHHQTYYHR